MSYRLLSYRSGREARAGVLVGEQIYDAAPKRIGAGKSKVKGAPLKRAKLLAPVLYPGNIYCAGANYTDHMAEMARAQGKEPGPTMKDLGEKPWHFVKTS